MENNENKELREDSFNEKLEQAKSLLNDVPSDSEAEGNDDDRELSETDTGSDESKKVEDAADSGEESGDEISEGDIKEESEKEEENVEEKDKDEKEKEGGTTSSDEPSVVEDTPENKETTEEIPETPVDDVEQLKAKIEELEYEKSIADSVTRYNELVENNKKELNDMVTDLGQQVIQACINYGIPTDMDFNEMRETMPDKFNILQAIAQEADMHRENKLAELRQKEKEAAQKIVFAKAGMEMAKYDLTPEQSAEAANTFVRIISETGIKDLKEDMAAKVELAVAHAKMIKKDVQKVVEDTAKVVEDVKEAVEEVKEVTSKSKEEKLEAFKEGASVGSTEPAPEVTEANVMKLYFSKPEKERQEFFKEHQNLIIKVWKQNGGSQYSR